MPFFQLKCIDVQFVCRFGIKMFFYNSFDDFFCEINYWREDKFYCVRLKGWNQIFLMLQNLLRTWKSLKIALKHYINLIKISQLDFDVQNYMHTGIPLHNFLDLPTAVFFFRAQLVDTLSLTHTFLYHYAQDIWYCKL